MPSSPRLTTLLVNGSGDALTAARVVAFVRWLTVARPPAARDEPTCSHAPASPVSSQATPTAPSGRIAVWTTSHRSST